MRTNRMESFSDGVIAVAITLLALGITVPDAAAEHSLTWRRWVSNGRPMPPT